MIRGIDASSVQKDVPFAKLVGDGVKFAILKSQQGNDGFDRYFLRNAKAAVDHGVEPFAYAFYYPLPHLNPKAQAELFVRKLKGTPVEGRPIFLDYEWPPVVGTKGKKGWKEWGCTPAQIADSMRDNAAEVERLSGVKPVIYTYDWWWSSIRSGAPAYGYPTGGDVDWASDYPLWMAWYTNTGWPKEGDKPRIPKPWEDWLFWQFDGNNGMRYPTGVDSDFCVFNGTEQDLQTFIYGPGEIKGANEAVVAAHTRAIKNSKCEK